MKFSLPVERIFGVVRGGDRLREWLKNAPLLEEASGAKVRGSTVAILFRELALLNVETRKVLNHNQRIEYAQSLLSG